MQSTTGCTVCSCRVLDESRWHIRRHRQGPAAPLKQIGKFQVLQHCINQTATVYNVPTGIQLTVFICERFGIQLIQTWFPFLLIQIILSSCIDVTKWEVLMFQIYFVIFLFCFCFYFLSHSINSCTYNKLYIRLK